jgi:hypothetical protein
VAEGAGMQIKITHHQWGGRIYDWGVRRPSSYLQGLSPDASPAVLGFHSHKTGKP